ncbi:hypothetical protein QTP86_026455 [Hemibagrus guttatus]|nr:hypothetical protein QTP86_026455 [Hemibagrus guttatus]
MNSGWKFIDTTRGEERGRIATTVYSVQGAITQNQSVIQCTFNTSTTFNISTRAADNSYSVSIFTGSTNGTQLGNLTQMFESSTALDLSNATSQLTTQNATTTTSSPNVSTGSALNITRDGCGTSKMCVSNSSTCNLTGNSSCFFASSKLSNQAFIFELSGTTSGYVALGLTKQNSTYVFVCGNNNTGGFFFQTATQNGTALTSANVLNITRDGCGTSKLCVSNSSTCNLTGNSSCFFASSKLSNQAFIFELSGTTSGYVALGLTKQNSTYVFVCGNNNTGGFFFQTATQNGTALTSANVTTVYSVQGAVTQNQSVIQCTFNASTGAADNSYFVSIFTGSTNGNMKVQSVESYVEFWLKVRIACGKKLLLSLSVLAFREWKHFLDRNRENSPLLGWLRFFMIFLALVQHRLL